MDKPTRPRLFDELVEAFDDLKEWKEGKITLKTYQLERPAKPETSCWSER